MARRLKSAKRVTLVTKQGPRELYQRAPYPVVLEKLVEQLHYKRGWNFRLCDVNRGENDRGLTLIIEVAVQDSNYQEIKFWVSHLFIVPALDYEERSWRRWLFDQILQVELHEAMEFFRIGDEKPYAPSHGPGNNPYLIRERGTEDDAHTDSYGILRSD